jgi:regulation of enolase protein 1 (concanavalin A-like superfamily)
VTSEQAPCLSALPFALRSLGTPVAWTGNAESLAVAVDPETDWFVDPGTGEASLGAPALVGRFESDFTLSARVEVRFAATYDAGALVVWQGERAWAKLCLEYSPQHEPTIVSVVTDGTSDDCTSSVAGPAWWLRAARIGRACAFHASEDGRSWDFVRHFRLPGEDVPEIGFQAQSPLGAGCTVTFSEIRFAATTLSDLRSGE